MASSLQDAFLKECFKLNRSVTLDVLGSVAADLDASHAGLAHI